MYELFLISILFLMDAHVYEYNFYIIVTPTRRITILKFHNIEDITQHFFNIYI